MTTLQILQYLLRTYGKTTEQELTKTMNRITPFSSAKPIEVLWDQIQDGIELVADRGRPFRNEQVTTMAYNTLFNTGILRDACRE